MKINTLLKIIMDDVFTFAYCKDNQIDPDFAIKQLERIANELKNSDAETIGVFSERIMHEAILEENKGDKEYANQLRGMVDHLGLL